MYCPQANILQPRARFLRVYRAGSGDYTRDRHQWLDGLTMDDVLGKREVS